MLAAVTPLPVIGVPVPLKYLDGLDSLLSIVQMPAGVPVATVAVGAAPRNAGLLAVRILGASDPALRDRMTAFQQGCGTWPGPRARRCGTGWPAGCRPPDAGEPGAACPDAGDPGARDPGTGAAGRAGPVRPSGAGSGRGPYHRVMSSDFPAFALTEEHEALRAAVRELAEDKIAPRAAEVDESGEFPWDVFEALAKADFAAVHIPEAYGGAGADAIATAIVIEEVARACASSSLIPAVNKLGTVPLLLAGSEQLKQRYLPPVAPRRGDVLLRAVRAGGGL